MTQSSRPQADNLANGYVDSGPYSRDQWAQKLIIEWKKDHVTSRGPWYGYLNSLEVTNPAGVTIRVDTGAGYCNGSLLDSDAQVNFTPGTPGIASRTDKVVIVENNTNTAYDGTASGVVLDFPTVLTDYEGTASVPAYSALLAILRGNAVTGAATALVQTPSYWMIELARYNISNVPVISNLTDNRDFINAETKQVMVTAFGGRNFTDVTDDQYAYTGIVSGHVITLTDNKYLRTSSLFVIPDDYISDMTCLAVLANGNGGDIYGTHIARYGTCGTSEGSKVDNIGGFATETTNVTASNYACHFQLSMTSAAVGDITRLIFDRDATNVLDTVNQDMYFVGFLIEYFGYRGE